MRVERQATDGEKYMQLQKLRRACTNNYEGKRHPYRPVGEEAEGVLHNNVFLHK